MRYTVLIFLICFLGFPAVADEQIQVVTEELKTLNYQEDGVVKGEATAVVKKVLEKAGFQYHIRIYPWARAYNLASTEKNILIYTINRTRRREKTFKWIGLVYGTRLEAGLYRLKGNTGVSAGNLPEARSYWVGAVRDDVNHEYLVDNGFTRIRPVSSPKQYIKMLERGRVDMIIGSYPILAEALKEIGKPVGMIEKILDARVSRPYMAVSLKTPDDTVTRLKTAYNTLKSSGEIPRF